MAREQKGECNFETQTMAINRISWHWGGIPRHNYGKKSYFFALGSISKQRRAFWLRGHISKQDNDDKSISKPKQRQQIVLWNDQRTR